MADSLLELEKHRADLLAQISQVGDFGPGSITTTQGRCGNPSCHCHQPGERGHGPNLRLTYKVEGKTVTESYAALTSTDASRISGRSGKPLDLHFYVAHPLGARCYPTEPRASASGGGPQIYIVVL